MLIGTPWVEDGKLYNACALLDEGRIAALRFKANLPNYGVFDEKRLFARGPAAGPVTVRGIRVGVPICEDIWLEESEEYENVVECLAETGAEILVVPNGSPYARDNKRQEAQPLAYPAMPRFRTIALRSLQGDICHPPEQL